MSATPPTTDNDARLRARPSKPKPPRVAAERSYLSAQIRIDTPAPDAVLGTGFDIAGTASCELLKDLPGEPGIFVRNATGDIGSVVVRVGAAAPVLATPTGPQATPWSRWTFVCSGIADGPLTLSAEVFAASPPHEAGHAAASIALRIDGQPPIFSIDPPADVVRPSPPFIATLRGTAADNASGVAAVEWQLADGPFNSASGTTSWTADVPLPGLGQHSVAVRARDRVGNVSALQNISVRVGDITAPALAISAPLDGETFTLVDGQLSLELRGTASDTQSGVALVEWSLDGQTGFTPAVPKAAGDWSTWSALVPITAAGNRSITVRATDGASPAGNAVTLERHVVVALPFEPKDPEAVFGPTAYLDDLLGYACSRARTAPDGALVARQLLTDTYLQPFVALVARENRAIASRPVSQVRLCIEVLRRYMSRHQRDVPAAAEAAYRQAVYSALLRQLGTSSEEIRLARVAGDAARTALASRLGIALAQVRPDRLDQLLLQPATLTEAALQQLFGLEDTALKPLADSLLPEPLLVIWQKEQLRAAWQQQDDAARSAMDTPQPVIDPDLLVVQDLRTASPGNTAFDLLHARKALVTTLLAEMSALRSAQPTPQEAFDQLVGSVLGPVPELLAMVEARRNGSGIDAALRARRLTPQAFVHLMRVRELAVAGDVLDSEWGDVDAILLQVKKFALHAAWREEERQRGLILGPDLFQTAAPSALPVEALPAWRASAQARQAWRRTLESRFQQQQALTKAMQSVVSAAEQAALPLLRQACIAAIAGERAVDVIAEQLTQELGIDCKDSAHQQVTRAQQALATLQEVLLSLRTGRLRSVPPVLGTANPAAEWVLALDPSKPYTEADFDEEWRWMGSYATWHSAMAVFAYPENHLLPELRPAEAQTAACKKLLSELRNHPRLGTAQARKLAAAYLLALTDELGEALPPALRHGALVITEQLSDSQLAERRQFIRQLFGDADRPERAPAYLQEIFHFVPLALALQLQKSGQHLTALDWIETFYTDHLAPADRKIYRGLVLEESIPNRYQRNPDNWLRVGLNPHEIVSVRSSAHTRFTLMTLVRCYLDFADAEFTRDDAEALARARALYAAALALLGLPEMQPPGSGRAGGSAGGSDTGDSEPNPFPHNPVPQMLKMRAELNLLKLRSGRNIAGIEREATALAPPAPAPDRLPTAADRQRPFKPTPYRYGVLVERAKNLVNIAQQVEQAFLSSLERRDAEVYNLLQAGHDLQLAAATVDLHGLRVATAHQGVGLAEQQLGRASIQRDTYEGWIAEGLNRWETTMLASHVASGVFGSAVLAADAVLTAAQAAVSAASGGFLGTGASPAGMAATGAVAVAAYAKAAAGAAQIAAETTAQVSAAKASFERRGQEWALQRQLADADMAIGSQQLLLAQANTAVALQEELISRMQRDQAQATLEFLANKFTSAELYAWMSGILGGAYSYFLQQATAMAQLAQYQLAFERQEAPPAFIQADYWDAPDEGGRGASGPSEAADRQGMTGSVRLLQDLTRLDQFAFDSQRRKLQLAEVFSLARLYPVEFQHFRETGRLPFATPMSLFDRGFPGHYLRLIKRVRMSIIALVPPVQGVRATLVGSGISRVVTGGDVFQPTIVRRDPELIAFTSTSNASGLLDLEPDAGMLLPFESMGVDSHWELQLPKAANAFDYRSIADVLFTVEYTALHDDNYRRQVILQLDDSVSAERVISLRDHAADQWYALHNADPSAAHLRASVTLTPHSLPPNLEDLRIQQVLLAVVRAPGQTFELGAAQLMLTPQDESVAVGGMVDGSTDGLISTRRGNASAWLPLIGKTPAGTWELSLPNSEELRSRFSNDEIEDLLIVLTYGGRTPAWPA